MTNATILSFEDTPNVFTHVTTATPLPVTVADATFTGDINVASLGAVDDAKVVNPDAASATMPALLRGCVKLLTDLSAWESRLSTGVAITDFGTKSDEAWSGSGDGTLIAILKKIALNTTV